MTENEVKEMFEKWEQMREKCKSLADLIAHIRGTAGPSSGHDDNYELMPDGISVSWTQPCGRGCCSDAKYSFIPLTYFTLTKEEVIAAEKAQIEREKQKKAEEEKKIEEMKKQATLEAQRNKELKEKEEYERLKKKFENVG
jgi:hypothetical protein